MRKLILSVVALVILTLIGCSYSCEDKALTRTAMTGRPAVQQQATRPCRTAMSATALSTTGGTWRVALPLSPAVCVTGSHHHSRASYLYP